MLRLFSIAFAVVALGAGLVLASPGASAQEDDILDCEDFASQADAQAAYRADPSDPAGNDADGDGIACELYDGFEVAATDLEPIEGVGLDTTTEASLETTTIPASDVSTMASAGVGSAVADAAGSTGMAAIAGTLIAAAGCGALALRGLRPA